MAHNGHDQTTAPMQPWRFKVSDRRLRVAKFEVEVLEKAFVSVKFFLTSLLFVVDQKFHFITSLKF
jgi:hypothetical protein